MPANKIVLYGQSIGTVPTVDFASRHPEIAGVVLHSALASGAKQRYPLLETLGDTAGSSCFCCCDVLSGPSSYR